MEYEFTNNFFKDLKRLKSDSILIHLLGAKINETIAAASIKAISGSQPIRGTKVHYRFKIKTKTDIYRVGIKQLIRLSGLLALTIIKNAFINDFHNVISTTIYI